MKGYIYMIYSEDHNDIYIGSTVKSIGQRLQGHVSEYKKYMNEKYHYVTSFDILAKGNYKIKLIREIEYDSVELLRKQEGNVIKVYKKDAKYNVVNKVITGRTKQQYYTDHKDKIKTHKNTKSQCACGGCYTNVNKQRHMHSKKHNNQ